MPIVLALIAALGGAYIWYIRAKSAAQMTSELADVASDVMAAARRFGFRRRLNLHPVESIDEPNLAIAALAVAYLELDGLPTAEARMALLHSMQSHTWQNLTQAEESLILGRWLVNESQGPQMAVQRLARRLVKLDRKDSFEPLMAVLKDISAANGGRVTDRQREALEEISRAFGVS